MPSRNAARDDGLSDPYTTITTRFIIVAIDTELLTLAAGVFLLAGLVKGVVGIGLPTAAMGLLSQVIDPRVAIALVTMPMLISNIWQVWREGGIAETVRRFAPFAAPLMLVLYITTFVTAGVSQSALLTVLGLTVVAFAVMSLAWTPPAMPPRWDTPAQVGAGTLAGMLGGMTGIWSPPMLVYFLSAGIERDTFVRASGVLLTLGCVPMIAGFAQSGILTSDLAAKSAVLVVPTLLGFTVGEAIRRRMDVRRFRTVVLWVFLVMGLNILRKGVM